MLQTCALKTIAQHVCIINDLLKNICWLANHLKLGNEWNRKIDNDFAKRALASIVAKGLPLHNPETTRGLCAKCKQIRDCLFEPAFSITYNLKDLQISATKACRLCQIFVDAYQSRQSVGISTIAFERVGSSFMMNGGNVPVLSISRSSGMLTVDVHALQMLNSFRPSDATTGIDQQIQIGHPKLPSLDNNTGISFELLRQWLNCCDASHPECLAPTGSLLGQVMPEGLPGAGILPKRVIDVRQIGDDKVFLREDCPIGDGKWIALSHQWGSGEQFCTTVENRNTYIEDGIELQRLPKTFKHAVEVTRALKQSYLWIDSLCIIQGPGGDFNEQAKRMEQVYSGAYCVIASSRLPGHDAGFLQRRKQKDTVVLQQKGRSGAIYISNTIDDFNQHVLDGALNQRAWVLQEHALARRTVYFTDAQMYFECGNGVRCETLTRMSKSVHVLSPSYFKADSSIK